MTHTELVHQAIKDLEEFPQDTNKIVNKLVDDVTNLTAKDIQAFIQESYGV
jgi:hypothetical protein